MNLPMPLFSPEGVESGSGPAGSDSGAASATPAAPSAPTPATPSSGAAPQSTPATGGLRDASQVEEFAPDFDSIEDSIGTDEIVVTAPPQGEAPKVEEPTAAPPEAKPAEPKPEEQQPPVEQQGQQQQTPANAEPPTEAGPADLAAMLQQERSTLIKEIASKHFALSKEEVEELQDDAIAAVPKLLAKVHIDAVSTMLNHMATMVPKMITYHQKVTDANNAAKDQFFTAWPSLKGKDAEVARMATIYRQMNPQAKLEDVIRDVGPIVMAQLKIAAPPVTNGTAPQKPKPAAFAPALGGAAAPPSNFPAEVNPWEGLGRDFD